MKAMTGAHVVDKGRKNGRGQIWRALTTKVEENIFNSVTNETTYDYLSIPSSHSSFSLFCHQFMRHIRELFCFFKKELELTQE
jgi:hypothetical protein